MALNHQAMIERIISELFHEKWMGESDKKEFNEMFVSEHGTKMDSEIDIGIANGHTAEQQEMLCIEALKGKVSI
jgi:hypothetical protein